MERGFPQHVLSVDIGEVVTKQSSHALHVVAPERPMQRGVSGRVMLVDGDFGQQALLQEFIVSPVLRNNLIFVLVVEK